MNLAEAIAFACTSGPQLRLQRKAGILEIASHEEARSARARCASDGPDFDAVVPAKRMRESVATIGNEAALTCGKKGLKIQGEFGLTLVPAEPETSWRPDFPDLPPDAVKVDGVALRAAIGRVRPAMEASPHRPNAHGILLTKGGRAVAMSNEAMFVAPAPAGIDLYIPGQCVQAITSTGDAELTIAIVGHRFIVSTDAWAFTSSLLVDQPICVNHGAFIGGISPDAELVVPRAAFIRALEIAQLCKRSFYVMLTSSSNRLFVSATDDDGASESGCASTGNIHRAHVQPHRLKQAAEFLTGDTIKIKTVSPNKGVKWTTYSLLLTGADDAIALVQPGVPKDKE